MIATRLMMEESPPHQEIARVNEPDVGRVLHDGGPERYFAPRRLGRGAHRVWLSGFVRDRLTSRRAGRPTQSSDSRVRALTGAIS